MADLPPQVQLWEPREEAGNLWIEGSCYPGFWGNDDVIPPDANSSAMSRLSEVLIRFMAALIQYPARTAIDIVHIPIVVPSHVFSIDTPQRHRTESGPSKSHPTEDGDVMDEDVPLIDRLSVDHTQSIADLIHLERASAQTRDAEFTPAAIEDGLLDCCMANYTATTSSKDILLRSLLTWFELHGFDLFQGRDGPRRFGRAAALLLSQYARGRSSAEARQLHGFAASAMESSYVWVHSNLNQRMLMQGPPLPALINMPFEELRYDPAFLLPFVYRWVSVRSSAFDSRQFVDSNLLSYVVLGLAHPRIVIRLQSTEILGMHFVDIPIFISVSFSLIG